jgi:hypothetical protein
MADEWRQLPCANLQDLKLDRCWIQLNPSDSHPGILESCLFLTRFDLERATTLDSSGSLSAIAALQDLQDLRLNWLEGSSNAEGESEYPSSLLQLTKLTSLKLGHYSFQGCLKHLSSLANLQQLTISSYDSRVDCSPSTTPGLGNLSALTSIYLHGWRLDPTVLFDLTQLCVLKLTGECWQVGEVGRGRG